MLMFVKQHKSSYFFVKKFLDYKLFIKNALLDVK